MLVSFKRNPVAFSEYVTSFNVVLYRFASSVIYFYVFPCRGVVDESFADLAKVEGLRGIYIASQITLSPGLIRVGSEHISSLITFDRGGEWKRLEVPVDDDGQAVVCRMVSRNSVLTFRGPCIVIYSYNKTSEMH
jgi:hypothetical protein